MKLTIADYKGKLRIRYQLQGKTQTISTGLNPDPHGYQRAELLKRQIQIDAETGHLKPGEVYRSMLDPARYADLTSVKTKVKREPYKTNRKIHREPLTDTQIKKLIAAFYENSFDLNASHYAPWLEFLALTGCRPAEAIGLRKSDIDFSSESIQIARALARQRNNSASSARIKKGTKNGKIRFLPMSKKLLTLVKTQVKTSPTDLVFPSPKGLAIDDRNFSKRIYKPYLKALGLPNRDLYNLRHAFVTRALKQGMSVVHVAYLIGDSPASVTKFYAHSVRPDELPPIPD
ncbi:tyrosine-type recombinase/integrase [Egbenema bharatensis]|uniref:tyrosine-type recombinase/integrase n=1 Tax=Egbenema bharatensis TaxID=3463334 RepID=UPI003A89B4F5